LLGAPKGNGRENRLRVYLFLTDLFTGKRKLVTDFQIYQRTFTGKRILKKFLQTNKPVNVN
jgi:hypothetical protein